MRVDERLELRGGGDGGPVGLRHPQLLKACAHAELVLRVRQRFGPRIDGHSRLNEGGEDILRNVLVVERDHVDVLSEGQHRRRVVVVPHGGGGQRRRHVGLLRQDANLHTEFDRGRDHHPSQLPTTDDSYAQRHDAPLFFHHLRAVRATA